MRTRTFSKIATCLLPTLFLLPIIGCGGDGSDAASEASSDADGADTNDGQEGEEDGMAMGGPAGMGGGDPSMMEDMEGMSGMEDMEGMESEYGEQYAQMSGRGGPGGNTQQKSSRPADLNTWTKEQLLEAVKERDSLVPAAIQASQASAASDQEFAHLMTEVLATASGVEAAAAAIPLPGVPGFPSGVTPGTNPAGQKPVPPGGVFLDNRHLRLQLNRTTERALDSMEIMLGEAMLGYAPQAVQGSRGAAERLQGAATGQGSAPGAGPSPEMQQRMQSQMQGEMEAGDPAMMDEFEYGDAGGGQRNGSLLDREIVQAVVQALVKNDSVPAWRTLKAILAGSIVTPLAVEEAAEVVMVQAFSGEAVNAEMAQQLLSATVDNVIADPVQNAGSMRLLAAIAQNPTDHFLHLAELRQAAATGGAAAGQGNNRRAMANGNQQEAMMEQMEEMGDMEGNYGGESGAGPGAASGTAPPAAIAIQAADLPEVNLSEAAMLPVASVLWKPSTVAMIAKQLKSAESPAAVADALAFASNIPSGETRHAAYDLFFRSHAKGAVGLVSSGLFTSVAHDPGMLAVLKALPRERPQSSRNAGANVAAAASPAASWTSAIQETMLSLRDRLRKVADDPALAYTGQQPVRLHRDGVAERSIAVMLPGDSADLLGDAAPSPTKVYYTRLRVAPNSLLQQKDMADHYEKRTKGVKRMVGQMLWYDGGRSANGVRTTMDVVIEQAQIAPGAGGFSGVPGGGGGGGGGGGAPQYTIEIIVVETRDPKDPPSDARVTAAATTN
ncbi:MAG: hypothetical protein P8J37_22440 [Fuerstiella sp.]|nr:hypothetical protein [Fuerstiella sp.]